MGKCLKTHTHTKNKNKKKKQKNRFKKNPKIVVTIIFYGKLSLCKRAYIYESLERTPI